MVVVIDSCDGIRLEVGNLGLYFISDIGVRLYLEFLVSRCYFTL